MVGKPIPTEELFVVADGQTNPPGGAVGKICDVGTDKTPCVILDLQPVCVPTEEEITECPVEYVDINEEGIVDIVVILVAKQLEILTGGCEVEQKDDG